MQNFDEKWGPIHPHAAPTYLSKRSEQLLHDLGPKHCTKLTGWLAGLVENAPDGSKRVDTWLSQRYALIEASARIWIDNILLHLKQFATEFNDSDTGEHLQITIESPKDTFVLPCRRDPSFEPYKFTCYAGHVVSFNWALLVRSYYETIEVFLVPSEMLLSLQINALNSGNVKPLAEFHAAVNDEQVIWALAGVTVELETVPAMCRELFGDFVKVALQTIDASELHFPAAPSEVQATDAESRTSNAPIIATIKELQLWQAREIISRALKQDSETLLTQSTQPQLPLSDRSQIDTLRVQVEGLQQRWLELLKQMPCEAPVISAK